MIRTRSRIHSENKKLRKLILSYEEDIKMLNNIIEELSRQRRRQPYKK